MVNFYIFQSLMFVWFLHFYRDVLEVVSILRFSCFFTPHDKNKRDSFETFHESAYFVLYKILYEIYDH